ncbi:MAG: flavodoxin domain-containing protein [Spirochaetales bacterium]|nr:flavodoxin domain-containing protein [Spirochaetales bacterium]
MNDTVQLIYGTKRGTTKIMANIIGQTLMDHGSEVKVKNVFEAQPGDLPAHRINILGSSTWSDGDLQIDFVDFERRMDELDLQGTFAAVFGPGNSRFPRFCEAVEILQAKLVSLGARLLVPSLKVDELAGRLEQDTKAWAETLAQAVKGIA